MVEILRRLERQTPKGCPLARVSASKYRSLFNLVNTRLALPYRYTPHSPRAGFASDGYTQGKTVEQMMIDGRWSVLVSFKQYLDVISALEVIVSQATRHPVQAGVESGTPDPSHRV